MIIKWPERYSLVMLLHAFIHELKISYRDDNKKQHQQKPKTKTKNQTNEIATKYDISSEKEAPANQMNEIFYVHRVFCSQTQFRLQIL